MTMVLVCDVCGDPVPEDERKFVMQLTLPAEFIQGANSPEDKETIDVCGLECLAKIPDQLDPNEEVSPDQPALIPQSYSDPIPAPVQMPQVVRRS